MAAEAAGKMVDVHATDVFAPRHIGVLVAEPCVPGFGCSGPDTLLFMRAAHLHVPRPPARVLLSLNAATSGRHAVKRLSSGQSSWHRGKRRTALRLIR